MDTAERVPPPIETDKQSLRPLYHLFLLLCTLVTSQVLQPKTVNKCYRGRRMFSSVIFGQQ